MYETTSSLDVKSFTTVFLDWLVQVGQLCDSPEDRFGEMGMGEPTRRGNSATRLCTLKGVDGYANALYH